MTPDARIHSSEPFFPASEVEWVLGEIRSVLDCGILTRGSRVAQFEELFATCAGTRHAVAMSNGTTALEVILRHRALAGGEVIVPTNTFLASANVVIFAGGVPVLCDIDPASLCVGLAQIESRVTERTRGVIVVHIAGLICPQIDAIRAFCRERGLFLIEDAAHAHGAQWRGARAGSLGDAAAFSFFPTKPMATGEGGMITTNDDTLAAFARTFRNHGVPDGSGVHEALGHNYRLDELSAVLGISQARRLDEFLKARQEIARCYEAGLGGLRGEGLGFIETPAGMRHSYYKFPVVLRSAPIRDAVARGLKERHGIETGTIYWPPCHLQPVVRERPDLYRCTGSFTAAEDILPRVLCLPIHARLSAESVDRVVEAVRIEIRNPTS